MDILFVIILLIIISFIIILFITSLGVDFGDCPWTGYRHGHRQVHIGCVRTRAYYRYQVRRNGNRPAHGHVYRSVLRQVNRHVRRHVHRRVHRGARVDEVPPLCTQPMHIPMHACRLVYRRGNGPRFGKDNGRVCGHEYRQMSAHMYGRGYGNVHRHVES